MASPEEHVAGDHLDENAVVDYLGGMLTPSSAARVEEHMDRCPECRRLIAQVGAAAQPAPPLSPNLGEAPTEPGTDPTMLPPPGELLASRFRLRRVLGRGAMGLVYEADDEVLKVRVALKLLVPEVAANPTFLAQLHKEIVVGRRISHPNVCRIYDLGTSQELHFIIMEYVSGDTLERRLADQIPRGAGVQMLDEVCAALDAAHREGVVHRDLKPSNIMVDATDKVKVMDFGLARDLTAEQSHRVGPVGTPAYWAPEQGRGEPATPASDIYSLGVIAYRILAGRRFSVSDAASLAGLPAPYRKIVARCTAARPEDRYGSVKEVRAALASAAIASAAPQRGARARWPIGLALAAIAASLIVYLAAREPAPALAPAVPADAPPTESLAASPDAAPASAAAAVPDASSPDAPRRKSQKRKRDLLFGN